MPSTHQSGDNIDYSTSYERQIAEWREELCLRVVPMTREAALGYWNAVNTVECSDRVWEHYRECLREFDD